MREDRNPESSSLRILCEFMLSLSAAFALIFALLTFFYGGGWPHASARFLLRPGEKAYIVFANWINASLHRDNGNVVGNELAWILLTFGLGIMLFSVLRLLRRTVLSKVGLYPVGGLMVIGLVPAFWLYALNATWVDPDGLYPFWRSGPLSLFVLEIPIMCGFLYLSRGWRYSTQVWVALLVVHYVLWTDTMWWVISRIPTLSPRFLFLVFPASGFVWLWYVRERLKRLGGPAY